MAVSSATSSFWTTLRILAFWRFVFTKRRRTKSEEKGGRAEGKISTHLYPFEFKDVAQNGGSLSIIEVQVNLFTTFEQDLNGA